MRTTTHKLVRNVFTVFHTAEAPSDEEWALFFESVDRHLSEFEVMVVLTAGGGPNARQRDYAARFWRTKHRKPTVAVLTPSRYVKAIAGALGWLAGFPIKAFAAEDFDGAFSYLRLSADQRSAVEAALLEMKKELG
jgi:hypothetical protein